MLHKLEKQLAKEKDPEARRRLEREIHEIERYRRMEPYGRDRPEDPEELGGWRHKLKESSNSLLLSEKNNIFFQ